MRSCGCTLAWLCALTIIAGGCEVEVVLGVFPPRAQIDLGQPVSPAPCLRFSPAEVVFAALPPGSAHTQQITAWNACGAAVSIQALSWRENRWFSVSGLGGTHAGSEGPIAPVVLGAHGARTLEITYSAGEAALTESVLVFHGPHDKILAELPVLANSQGPQLNVAPVAIDVGCQLKGTVTWRPVTLASTGGAPVELSNVRVTPASAGFILQRAFIPGPLEPGADRVVMVGYAAGGVGDGPEVTWDEARLEISSPDYVAPIDVLLQGFTREASCEGLRVTLMWNTPGDPDSKDEGPEAGADLDLHLRHPFAVDWFDLPFDAFWSNASPTWGNMSNAQDDPSSGPDDVDGLGPEVIVIPIPEPGVSYRVGVHYWADNGFGPSTVQIRVSIFGQLIHETSLKQLQVGELWEALDIPWSKGSVVPVTGPDGGDLVHSNYDTPCTPKACPE